MRARILLIDDEELVVKSIEKLLKKEGYEVICAKNDQEALRHVGNNDFNLVVCDIRMPGKNGVEIILEVQRLLSSEGRGTLPVIFLTGFADQKIEKEAQALNPAAYIFKPFDVPKLLAVIRSSLNQRG